MWGNRGSFRWIGADGSTGEVSRLPDGYLEMNPEESWEEGFNAGREEGQEQGYDDGYDAGYDNGYEAGRESNDW